MATQLNFAQQMDAVLKTLRDARPRLLLHACCGPCSSAVLEQGPQQACSSSRGRASPRVFNTASICCAKFN